MQQLSHPAKDDITLDGLLDALANPTRRRIVRRLAGGETLTCGTVLPDVTASTASRHWHVLRSAGVLTARREGREILHTLRREDLDERFPGLLDAVLAAE